MNPQLRALFLAGNMLRGPTPVPEAIATGLGESTVSLPPPRVREALMERWRRLAEGNDA